MVWIIFTILLYIFGAVNTYELFDKTTEQSMFGKIWFSVLWPTISMLTLVNYITTLIKKAKKK